MNEPIFPPQRPAMLGSDGCWHLDVRGLPPPQPLLLILRQVEAQGHDGRALLVQLDRDPVLLYPELAERGWQAEPLPCAAGAVRLRLRPT